MKNLRIAVVLLVAGCNAGAVAQKSKVTGNHLVGNDWMAAKIDNQDSLEFLELAETVEKQLKPLRIALVADAERYLDAVQRASRRRGVDQRIRDSAIASMQKYVDANANAIRTLANGITDQVHPWNHVYGDEQIAKHEYVCEAYKAVLKRMTSKDFINAAELQRLLAKADAYNSTGQSQLLELRRRILTDVVRRGADLGPDPTKIAENDEAHVRDRASYNFLKSYFTAIGDIASPDNKVAAYLSQIEASQAWMRKGNPTGTTDLAAVRKSIPSLETAYRLRQDTLASYRIEDLTTRGVHPDILTTVQTHHQLRVRLQTRLGKLIDARKQWVSSPNPQSRRTHNKVAAEMQQLETLRKHRSVEAQLYATLLSTGAILGEPVRHVATRGRR